MTKKEIALQVQRSTGLTASQSEDATDAVFSALHLALANHKDVFIRGFGTFKVVHRESKKARNIVAGTTIEVPAKDVVKFKQSKQLKINPKYYKK